MRKVMKKVKSQWVVCALALGVIVGVSTSLTTEDAYAATKANYHSTIGSTVGKGATHAGANYKAPNKPTKHVTPVKAKTVVRKEVKPVKLAYNNVYVYDAKLKPGQERVVFPGRDGLQLDVYTITTVKGKETSRELSFSTLILAPKDRIIKTGTKQVTKETKEEVVTTEIPYEVTYVENDQVALGTETTLVEGKEGTSTKTYSNTYNNGVLSESVLLKEEVVAPVNKVIEKGTLVVSYVDREEKEVTPYETRYVENSSLEVGTEVVTQEGKDGETVHKYVDTVINGEVTESAYKGATVIIEVVDQIIEQGTKTTTEETRTTPVSYETINKETRDLSFSP